MKKTSDLKKFHDRFVTTLTDIERYHEFPNHFYQAFLSGDNKIYQKSIYETKTFDEEWIKTIESYFPSLDKITKDPKSGLRYEQDVTIIEKAKKISSDSIRHLSSNTHLIKEVTKDGVIPQKILTTQAEIEYGIYENRFIKTLINRLFDFVKQRHEIVKNNIESFQKKHFNLTSNFEIRDTKVEMNIDLNLIEDLENESLSRYNRDFLNRIQSLLKKVSALKTGLFMESVKHVRPVQAPIIQTSIILKNVNYRNCYMLWLFLDKYNTLAFELDVSEKNLTFDQYYLKNVYQTALITFSNVYANQKILEDHYQYLDKQDYKKKTPKFIKKHLSDIMEQPDPYEIEDVELNQFYLDQNKKVFSKNLTKHLETSSSFDIGLRKALRDTLAISNALYESYFELYNDEEFDIFRSMVKKDKADMVEDAREKAKIARIIREVKEVDFNNAVRLEKRMLQQLEDTHKDQARYLTRKMKDEGKRVAAETMIKQERATLKTKQGLLSAHFSYVAKQKQLLRELQIETTKRIRNEAAELRQKEKEIIIAEKQKAKEKYELELKRIKEKQKLQAEKLALKVKKEKELQKERLKLERQRLKEQSSQKVKAKKAEIKTRMQEKVVKAEEKLAA
ncbi:MAG: DUF2357 domain-containing protein [Acholeplasmataceae bacterium]